jgi:hypothetical protein
MDLVEFERIEKGQDGTTYRTYDEQRVSRQAIDRAVQTIDPVTYRTYDERPIDRVALVHAMREWELQRERHAWLYQFCLSLLLNTLCATIIVIVLEIYFH